MGSRRDDTSLGSGREGLGGERSRGRNLLGGRDVAGLGGRVAGLGSSDERKAWLSKDFPELPDTSMELSMGVLSAGLEGVNVDVFPTGELDEVPDARLDLGSLALKGGDDLGLDEGVPFRETSEDSRDSIQTREGRRGFREESEVARERAEETEPGGVLSERGARDELVEESDDPSGMVLSGGRRSTLLVLDDG